MTPGLTGVIPIRKIYIDFTPRNKKICYINNMKHKPQTKGARNASQAQRLKQVWSAQDRTRQARKVVRSKQGRRTLMNESNSLPPFPDTYVYVIKDEVSGQVSPLFMAPNDASARRQLKGFLEQVPSGAVASDFNLYAVGRFNPSTLRGNMSSEVYPVLVPATQVPES